MTTDAPPADGPVAAIASDGGYAGVATDLRSVLVPRSVRRRSRPLPRLPQRRHETIASLKDDAGRFVDLLSAFFLQSGLSRVEVRKVLEGAAGRVDDVDPEITVEGPELWRQVGEAISFWWRDLKYLDNAGRPLPLNETGGAPSVDALLARFVEPELQAQAKEMIRRIISVRRDGRWMLIAGPQVLRITGQQSVDRLRVVMAGLLRTFLLNMGDQDPATGKNCDVVASVGTYPVAKIKELRRRMSEVLPSMASDVDATLTRGAEQARGQTREVGVAFVLYDLPRRGPTVRRAKRARG